MVRGVRVLLAVAALSGIPATSASAAPQPCWQQLVKDWTDGRIADTYPVSCYRQALARMPEDLEVYSSAPDDIEAALQRQVHRIGARSLALSTSSRAGEPSAGWFGVWAVLGLAGGLALAFGAALVAGACLRVRLCTGLSRFWR